MPLALTGADGDFIRAKKRPVKTIDYGFAGDLLRDLSIRKTLANCLMAASPLFLCA
jgi:acetylglutamate kinase